MQTRNSVIIGNFKNNTRHKGRRWTPVEDARITAEDRLTDRKLSKALGRSAQAIQQRRYVLSRNQKNMTLDEFRQSLTAATPG